MGGRVITYWCAHCGKYTDSEGPRTLCSCGFDLLDVTSNEIHAAAREQNLEHVRTEIPIRREHDEPAASEMQWRTFTFDAGANPFVKEGREIKPEPREFQRVYECEPVAFCSATRGALGEVQCELPEGHEGQHRAERGFWRWF